MRILMCHKFHFLSGGAETYLFSLCNGLSRLGHVVINFSTYNHRNVPSNYSEYFVKMIDFSKISVHHPFYNIKAASNFIYSFEAKNNIDKLIDRFSPDIAHIHNIYHHLSNSILHVLRKKRIPIVMTLHDYKLICPNYSLFTKNEPCERCKGGKFYNSIIYKCLKDSYLASFLACFEMYFSKILKIYENNISLFIAPSIFIKNKMIEFGLDRKKIYYLPYSIDLSIFTPNFEPGKYVLYFGKLSSGKGVETLLKSAELLQAVPIKIIGDGPERERFELIVRRKKLSNVEFLGYKSRQELIGFIRDALFIVVPSEWYEVSGLNIYESFASGKCVVASNIGGIPELVEDSVTGLLFRSGDHNELTEKMRYLINNPWKIKELSKNAFEKICRINNREIHHQTLLNIYNQLIKDNN